MNETIKAIMAKAGGDKTKAARAVWARLRDDGGFRNEIAVYLVEITTKELQGEATRPVPEGQRPHASALQVERDGEARGILPQGQTECADPSQPIAGEGQGAGAGNGHPVFADAREPISLSEAGRILGRAAHPSGAGALRAAAYDTRLAVRGESWLLNYQIPDGPRLLSLRWGEILPMAKRMVREAGHRAFAAVLLRAVHDEGRKLGKMPEDCPIESTLPPSIIAKLSDELSAERVIASARAWVKSEAAKEIRA